MTTAEHFKKHDYVLLENVLSIEICELVKNYVLLSENVFFSSGYKVKNAQVPNMFYNYGDIFMDSLLPYILPIVEKNTGLSLEPTYSMYRVYRNGAELPRHKDRESCEISATICWGYDYKDKEYQWPIFVDNNTENREKFLNKPFVSKQSPGKPIYQKRGDILIYKGIEVEHWREKFIVPTGSYHVQSFLHYIDKTGPYYPEYKWDKRISLGAEK